MQEWVSFWNQIKLWSLNHQIYLYICFLVITSCTKYAYTCITCTRLRLLYQCSIYTSYFIYFSFNSLVIKNSINNFNSCSLNKNEWLSHLKTQKTPYCMMNISSCPRYAWLQLKPIHLYWIFEVLNYQNW